MSIPVKYKLKEINRKLKLFKLAQVQITKDTIKSGQTVYKIKVKPERQEQEITDREKQAGRFILATNVLFPRRSEFSRNPFQLQKSTIL